MFGIADYGAFCAAILLFLALPGPGTFALLTSTGKGGFRAGAAATAGLIIGDQILLWLAVAGVAALLAAHPAWFKAVQYLGAAYLGWIGLRLLLAARRGRRLAATHPATSLPAPGTVDHPAQSEGDHLLHGLLPAVHQSGHASRRADLRRHGADHCRDHRAVLPGAVRLCAGCVAKSARPRRLALVLQRVAGLFLVALVCAWCATEAAVPRCRFRHRPWLVCSVWPIRRAGSARPPPR